MGYPLLPVPPSYRGPSGERGQVLLDGIVKRVSLFHGRFDDEADWHVYIRPDDWSETFYCEVMVVDDFDKPFIGDDKFYTADVTDAFALVNTQGSANPAFEVGREAIDDQGDEINVTEAGVTSRLVTDRGRAYLQGAYVNDEDHGTRVEIHPLDSIAFAIRSTDEVVSSKFGEDGWPTDSMTWRVAFFANSSLHRVNDENHVNKERTTTWLLDLPRPHSPVANSGGFSVKATRRNLQLRAANQTHKGRGVKSVPRHELVIDPSDGRLKLKVSATMKKPDTLGGLVIMDYVVKSRPPDFA